MSDQVHKTLLACDGLNRTGQEAPASHGKKWSKRKGFQVAVSKIRVYTKSKETSGKECQRWEDGKDRHDNDIHTREQSCDRECYRLAICRMLNSITNEDHLRRIYNLTVYLFQKI